MLIKANAARTAADLMVVLNNVFIWTLRWVGGFLRESIYVTMVLVVLLVKGSCPQFPTSAREDNQFFMHQLHGRQVSRINMVKTDYDASAMCGRMIGFRAK